MLRRVFFVFSIVFTACILFMVSCRSNDSELEITNGLPTSNYDRVVFMVLSDHTACTATILSHNTILTAAHCLPGQDLEDRTIYVQLGPEHFVMSEKYMQHPKHVLHNYDTYQYDLAVVVFEDNTFAGFAPLKITNYYPQPSDKVTLVGFGCFTKLQEQPDGNKIVVCDANAGYSKRVGKNHIYDKTQGAMCTPGMIQVSQQHATADSEKNYSTGEDAIMGAMDSGGPLLLDPSDPNIDYYKLIGIASYVNSLYVDGRFSCYADPSYPDNITFLKDAVWKLGARINFD